MNGLLRSAPDAAELLDVDTQRAGGPRIRMYIFAVLSCTHTMREERAVEGPGSTSSSSAATGGERRSPPDAAELLDVDTERAGGPRIRMYILGWISLSASVFFCFLEFLQCTQGGHPSPQQDVCCGTTDILQG